jgi:hypothetical protein
LPVASLVRPNARRTPAELNPVGDQSTHFDAQHSVAAPTL